MKKGILLTLIALFLCQMVVFAQNYDRYNYFHEEAVKLKNEGKLNEAKEKFKRIWVICKGGIPEDNDLDKMIRECTTISFSENNLQFEAKGNQTKQVNIKVNADSFKVRSSMEWCKVAKKGKTISVSCERNDAPTSRNASVSVSADGKIVSFDVLQLGGQLEFEARPNEVHFSKESEIVGISIATNADSWGVESAPVWIDYQISDSMLYMQSMQNDRAYVRKDTLYVVVLDELFPIAVSQAASDTTIFTDKKELVLPSSAAEERLMVRSNLNGWKVLSSDDWIQVQTEADTVNVIIQENNSLFSRHGWLRLELGKKTCVVPVHQFAHTSALPELTSEIKSDGFSNRGSVAVKSMPSDLKVTIIDDAGETSVRYTPFDIPVDYGHYSLQMGFERREVFVNDQQEDVVFKPGLRFATLTWAPMTDVGLMSGFVGANSWGAYAHFQAHTPFVGSFDNSEDRDLAGYSLIVGPVFRPNKFPYLGAYVGVGIGGYILAPHIGFDYEAGLMGFYKNVMISMGFHTSQVFPTERSTAFVMGVGGYLKRYYDSDLGYCASDSRRWTSVNYVFRPSEHGKGFMVGDLGDTKVRGYIKALYLPLGMSTDSIMVRNIELSTGVVFTPVNGLIDLCAGVSVAANITGLERRFQGIGMEVGTILNIWRFPITVIFHESDILGERHLCVDFGFGFHLGDFGKSKCSYQ